MGKGGWYSARAAAALGFVLAVGQGFCRAGVGMWEVPLCIFCVCDCAGSSPDPLCGLQCPGVSLGLALGFLLSPRPSRRAPGAEQGVLVAGLTFSSPDPTMLLLCWVT